MATQGDVRFVRVRGRIIPIGGKSGSRSSKPRKAKVSALMQEPEHYSRGKLSSDRALPRSLHGAKVGFGMGALVGGITGAFRSSGNARDIAKSALRGAGILGAAGAVGGAAGRLVFEARTARMSGTYGKRNIGTRFMEGFEGGARLSSMAGAVTGAHYGWINGGGLKGIVKSGAVGWAKGGLAGGVSGGAMDVLFGDRVGLKYEKRRK